MSSRITIPVVRGTVILMQEYRMSVGGLVRSKSTVWSDGIGEGAHFLRSGQSERLRVLAAPASQAETPAGALPADRYRPG